MEKFTINLPEKSVISLLLEKDQFYNYALSNNILIPNSVKLSREGESINKISNFKYPLVIKPSCRTKAWNDLGNPKIFICEDELQFRKNLKKSFLSEKELVVQEFIAGGDSDVYFCMVYYSDNSECIEYFVGRKLHQWAYLSGSTATATISDNEHIHKETIRIFDKLKFKGYGSIEYKYNVIDGKYYLIEPTVARLNQQQFVATVHGKNFPIASINHEGNFDFPNRFENKIKSIYIDEWETLKNLIYNLFVLNKSYHHWKKHLCKPFKYRYWSREDPIVFIFSLLKFYSIFSRKVWNK